MPLKLDYANLNPLIRDHEITQLEPLLQTSLEILKNKTGQGSDFLGWVDLPEQITPEELGDIQSTAEEIRAKCDVFISVGIGGSYLGGRAVSEALFGSAGPHQTGQKPLTLYAGHQLSSRQAKRLMEFIKDKDVCINVISKSGTTTEPGIAFRLLKNWMEKKYGDAAAKRIFATTDKERGALKKLATQKGYKTFIIPDDVGGRFSVLTPVGLLPLAVSGVDIEAFVKGFKNGRERFLLQSDFQNNPAMYYAGARHLLNTKGKVIEILADFEPDLHSIAEWWKQLYGESEGKDGRGIFPAAIDLTTDLHSMGQYIQDGERNLFETFLMVKDNSVIVNIPEDEQNLDGLNYLSALGLGEINFRAYQGTALAHRDGGVPNMTIWIDEISAESLGELLYFFEIGVALSGYLSAVNPFDQPGVEAYKKNMFALLEKPGFEEETEKIIRNIEAIPPLFIPGKDS